MSERVAIHDIHEITNYDQLPEDNEFEIEQDPPLLEDTESLYNLLECLKITNQNKLVQDPAMSKFILLFNMLRDETVSGISTVARNSAKNTKLLITLFLKELGVNLVEDVQMDWVSGPFVNDHQRDAGVLVLGNGVDILEEEMEADLHSNV